MSKAKEQEEFLENLVKEAQSHPVFSGQRRQAIEKLLNIISKELDFVYHISSKTRTEEYEEAKQEVLLYIFKNIDKYNSELGSFINWVHSIFKYRLLDAKTLYMKKSISFVPIDEFNFSIYQIEEPPSLIEILINIIEKDPEDILKQTHIKGNPKANMRDLLLLRLNGISWSSIAQNLGSSIPTLSSFYQRSLSKLVPKIKEYLNHV